MSSSKRSASPIPAETNRQKRVVSHSTPTKVAASKAAATLAIDHNSPVAPVTPVTPTTVTTPTPVTTVPTATVDIVTSCADATQVTVTTPTPCSTPVIANVTPVTPATLVNTADSTSTSAVVGESIAQVARLAPIFGGIVVTQVMNLMARPKAMINISNRTLEFPTKLPGFIKEGGNLAVSTLGCLPCPGADVVMFGEGFFPCGQSCARLPQA